MLPRLQLMLGGVPHSVSTYGVCAVLAALLGGVLAWPRLHKCGLRSAQAAALLLCMAAAFLIGARLWNVAASPANYEKSLSWYSLRFAGLSLYGGILGGMVVLLLLLRRWTIPAWAALDGLVAPACSSFMVARLGCFAAGCCAGRVTAAPWGLVFPARVTAQEALGRLLPLLGGAKPLHPTQLYELFGAAFCLALVWAMHKGRCALPGSRFLLFGSLFCIMRLIVLPFRALAYPELVSKILYPALYGGLALTGLGILLYRIIVFKKEMGGQFE